MRFEERLAGGGSPRDPSEGLPGESAFAEMIGSSPLRRVFDVPATVESEIVEAEEDAETGLRASEELRFVSCEAPALGASDELPFVARVYLAQNGETFSDGGHPVTFVAHDPRADSCSPVAVPVPPSAASAGKGQPGAADGARLTITGRNLYPTGELAVRLRYGGGDGSTLPLEAVAFDEGASGVTAVLPGSAADLVGTAELAGGPGAPGSGPSRALPAARRVGVEVSFDGMEYFPVRDRLTLYTDSSLSLLGDGRFQAESGGVAELATKTNVYRGLDPRVRVEVRAACGLW